MDLDTGRRAGRAERRTDAGVEGNARLTSVNAVVLLVLRAAEGFTLLGIRQMAVGTLFGVLLLSRVGPWLAGG